MQIWIANPAVQSPPESMPNTAAVDVTLRRLLQFKILPDRTYAWRVSQSGRVVASGKARPDNSNLLTIPAVQITTAPIELSVKADQR
jgi:hypothetical protein